MDLVPFESYVKAAEKLVTENPLGLKRIAFVSSEDPAVIEEASNLTRVDGGAPVQERRSLAHAQRAARGRLCMGAGLEEVATATWLPGQGGLSLSSTPTTSLLVTKTPHPDPSRLVQRILVPPSSVTCTGSCLAQLICVMTSSKPTTTFLDGQVPRRTNGGSSTRLISTE